MATRRWSWVPLVFVAALLMAPSARADGPVGDSTVIKPGTAGTPKSPAPQTIAPQTTTPPATAPSSATPDAAAPLLGLQQSGAMTLVPPGSASAARNDGLAGSPGGVDLAYTPPADRDSYLNSKDFAQHLENTPGRRHRSALSQLGGVAEGMAINGALGAGSSLILGGQ